MLSSLARLELGETSPGCGRKQEPTWCLLVLLMAVLFAPHSNPGWCTSFTNFLGENLGLRAEAAC